MNSEVNQTIRVALEQQHTITQKDIRLYTSLGNQVTLGEISILEKAKVRLVRIETALAAIDEYEAELAQLRAENAALREASEWQPLADGEVSSFIYVDNGGKLLGVFASDDYSDWYATEELPDGVRLCHRRTVAAQEANP